MINLQNQVIEFLSRCEDPTGLRGILRGLSLPGSDRQLLKSLIGELVRQGRVVKVGSRYWVPDGKRQSRSVKREKTKKANQVTGRLTLHPRGFGFVDASPERDWFIPDYALSGAQHGDTVRAQYVEYGPRGRKTGKVIGIERKGREQLLTVSVREGRRLVQLPLGTTQVTEKDLRGGGEFIEGSVSLWRRVDKGFRFDRVLGQMDDPAIDESLALVDNGVVSEIPQEICDEAEEIAANRNFELGGREDFTEEAVFTVDGADARDFDDAIHIKATESGYVLGVHIADVSHYVVEDSPLDRWAKRLGNSTYLPHRAFPMLPASLSTDLCSLVPHQPRYTVSVIASLNQQGKVLEYRVCRSLIRSAYRLTYTDVHEIGVLKVASRRAESEELTERLDLALKLADVLAQKRTHSGSLSLDLAEQHLTLTADQRLENVKPYSGHEGHRMIEMFMVLANELVARYLTERGIGLPYRVHETPDLEKLEQLANLMSARGFDTRHLLRDPASGINQLLKQIKGSEEHLQRVYQFQILRSLKLAEYAPENGGHFGLASDCYCHFTSPIRRYADLVVHRRLTTVLEHPKWGPEHFDDGALADVCRDISITERNSEKAERVFVKLKIMRHLMNCVGDEFDGVVTDVKPNGLFVELDDYWVDGLISMDVLSDDRYEYNADDCMLVGLATGKRFTIGDRLRVRIDRVDLVTRRLDFGIAGMKRMFGDRDRPRRERHRSGRGRGRPPGPPRGKGRFRR
ncbi:MAG: VacB/RNase II family 3'-5' exoribonuclease [Acidobacteria bacterium]|nr:VacB/RNase II family 3'-5' exoribonuclease [Acidobacteriota bacterium]